MNRRTRTRKKDNRLQLIVLNDLHSLQDIRHFCLKFWDKYHACLITVRNLNTKRIPRLDRYVWGILTFPRVRLENISNVTLFPEQWRSTSYLYRNSFRWLQKRARLEYSRRYELGFKYNIFVMIKSCTMLQQLFNIN